MPLRKMMSFDPAQFTQPEETQAAQSKDASSAEPLGIGAYDDVIEPPNLGLDFGLGISLNDFGLPIGEFSLPDFPERFSDSQSVELPDANSPSSQSQYVEGNLGTSENPDPLPPVNNGFVKDPFGGIGIGGLPDIPNFSAPEISLKSLITSDVSAIHTHLDQVGDSRPSLQTQTSHMDLLIPNAPADELRTSRLDGSISTSAFPEKQLVEDLLEQIKGLLLNVPQDQQDYWKNLFDELINQNFYTKTMQSNEQRIVNEFRAALGQGTAGNGIIYVPKENVLWDVALQQFSAFYEQLLTVQQPTQVNAAGDP